MGYPYYPPSCRGPLCPVHGDARDTSIAEPLLPHWDDQGISCACQDGKHSVDYTCAATRRDSRARPLPGFEPDFRCAPCI